MNLTKKLSTFITISLLAFVSVSQNLNAQKVKYKNLFPLLQSRNYAAAEKDLLLYLSSTDDEPNPYFYLGEIIVSKLDSITIFPDGNKYDSLASEAVKAYKKAKSLVTEREVKKNDEYYMAYNRRDLRTGKFGIKVSDVHLDYENKISTLERKKLVLQEILALKDSVSKSYQKLQAFVNFTFQKYADEQAFLWQVDPNETDFYDELTIKINNYESLFITYLQKLDQLNHPLHTPIETKVDLLKWGKMTGIAPDFEQNAIETPNFEKYFSILKAESIERITPLKAFVLDTHDSLQQAIKANSSAADSSNLIIVHLNDKLMKDLNNFKRISLANSLLKYMRQKSEMAVLENPIIFPLLGDSTNVFLRAGNIKTLYNNYADTQNRLNEIESKYSTMNEQDLSFYLEEFEPSFKEWLLMEKTINEKRLEELSLLNKKLQTKIQFFYLEKDTVYMPGFKTDSSTNFVQYLIEKDTSLITASYVNDKIAISKLGYDIVLKSNRFIENADSIISLLSIKDSYLYNTQAGDSILDYSVGLLNEDLELLWTFKYQNNNKVSNAKEQAGIYFLYNEEDEIFLTLNAKGEKIGQ